VLQYAAVCCSVLQCVAVCCSVPQCVTVCGSELQCDAVWFAFHQCACACSLSLSILLCFFLYVRPQRADKDSKIDSFLYWRDTGLFCGETQGSFVERNGALLHMHMGWALSQKE